MTAPLAGLSDEQFRAVVRDWLDEHVTGEFAELHGRGGPGDEDVGFDLRVRWERLLGDAGWIGLGWPVEHGGRGATVSQQIIWAEEYTRAEAPARVNHMGENLLAPTLIEFGTAAQCDRFLPTIRNGTERWCQGYSEPNAGSDLANVQTRSRRDGDRWVIDGQKVWTSLAHVSHWCFLLTRSVAGSQRHAGLTFLLVPMDQPGVEVRPIVQLTGGGEFNETFFTEAVTDADMVVGSPGDGWRVAMGLLGFERGISTLAQQVGFERELRHAVGLAREHRRSEAAVVRQRLMAAHSGLQLMRWNAMRSMGAGVPGPEASISKLFWGTWHRDLGNLMIDLLGAAVAVNDDSPDELPPEHALGPAGAVCDRPPYELSPEHALGAAVAVNDDSPNELSPEHALGAVGAVNDRPPYELSPEQRLFLFSRADTIYGGSNEIQRNVIGERVLGLPR